MSARAAVFEMLSTDNVLIGQWGIGPDQVWPAGSLDTAPRNTHFLVLRWAERLAPVSRAASEEVLTVWVHRARAEDTDYVPLIKILARIIEILHNAVQVVGEDGTLAMAEYRGSSPDFVDEGLDTITKNAEFRVVSR